MDHRQIKEDHIEIYGSDEGVSGGHGGGGGVDPGGDGEISEEMYQDDDMQDDGSQVSGTAGITHDVRAEEVVCIPKISFTWSDALYFTHYSGNKQIL